MSKIIDKICTLSGCPCRQTIPNFISCSKPFLNNFPNEFTNECGARYPAGNIEHLALDFQDVDQLNQFGVFSRLYSLSLSNNKLTHISREVFQDNKDLRFLAVAQNDLSSIEAGAFDPLINAKTIHLSDNPNLKSITTQ